MVAIEQAAILTFISSLFCVLPISSTGRIWATRSRHDRLGSIRPLGCGHRTFDFFNGQYYLYYTIPDVADATSGEPNCAGDSAIGVATSNSPLGPWTDSGAPVVEPRRGGPGCNFFWTYDPEVVQDGNGRNTSSSAVIMAAFTHAN